MLILKALLLIIGILVIFIFSCKRLDIDITSYLSFIVISCFLLGVVWFFSKYKEWIKKWKEMKQLYNLWAKGELIAKQEAQNVKKDKTHIISKK